jgi:hypothetical protein
VRWVEKESVIEFLSETEAIKGYLQFEHVFFLNSLFPFPVATAQLIGDVLTNRESVANFAGLPLFCYLRQ